MREYNIHIFIDILIARPHMFKNLLELNYNVAWFNKHSFGFDRLPWKYTREEHVCIWIN